MDDTITTTYYLCDEFLKAIGHRDDPQVRLSTAEVMTIPLVACAFFSGNPEASRSFLDEYGYIPKAISKSRFDRRLHAIDPCLWRTLFDVSAEGFKREHSEQAYVVDSLPVAVCDNIRIRRCKLYPPARTRRSLPRLHGQQTSLLLRVAGTPDGKRQGRAGRVRFSGRFGGRREVAQGVGVGLPEGSIIHAEKGYTDYHYEDLLEEVGLRLKAQRNKRSKRPMAAWEEFLSKPTRRYIETVFGALSALFAREIHAVTPRGFELKIVCFLLAFSIQCL